MHSQSSEKASPIQTAESFDVVTLGETMLRFTPPSRNRLEQADHLQVHIGGSESNTAVGLARLGLKTTWLSRLPSTALGRMVSGELARYGVDVSHVVWTDNARLGLYFLEEAGPPRGSQVIYDRSDSAISRMTPDELPRSLFEANKLRLFHTTGITLALSESTRETALLAAKLAKAAGALISFDINYRSKLWSPAAAAQHCQSMLQLADLIFIPDRDIQTLFQLPAVDEPERALETLAGRWPHATWVMTRGRTGSSAIAHGTFYVEGIFASDEVGRLGGGDAFSAGFLARYLESHGDVASSLRWGAATSALKYSIPGDLPLMTRAEVEALVKNNSPSTNISR
ncbi:MAG: sugar kinase [Pirellulaceae bacterium]|nr:sugar kinase [Pirellulaceae bacterium]